MTGYPTGMTDNRTQTELEALECQGWDTLCDGTSVEFYGKVMTDDGLMVLANGSTLGRDDVVEALRNAKTWGRYEMTDVHVVPIDHAGGVGVHRRGLPRRGCAGGRRDEQRLPPQRRRMETRAVPADAGVRRLTLILQ